MLALYAPPNTQTKPYRFPAKRIESNSQTAFSFFMYSYFLHSFFRSQGRATRVSRHHGCFLIQKKHPPETPKNITTLWHRGGLFWHYVIEEVRGAINWVDLSAYPIDSPSNLLDALVP